MKHTLGLGLDVLANDDDGDDESGDDRLGLRTTPHVVDERPIHFLFKGNLCTSSVGSPHRKQAA